MWKLTIFFFLLRSWAWECLGARGKVSLGAEMKYFFWTSVCFLVRWGEQLHLPGLPTLKHRKMWARSLWEQSSISKNPFVSQRQVYYWTWSYTTPVSPAVHHSTARAGPRLCQVPHFAISTQRHKKAFSTWTYSLWEFGSILKMSWVGCLNLG